MARGDWNTIEASTSNSRVFGGYEWRYANTEVEARDSNKDIIEVRSFIRLSNTTGYYSYTDLTSFFEYTIGSVTTKKNVITDYDLSNASVGKYYFGSNLPARKISGSGSLVNGINILTIEVPHNEDGTAPTFSIKWYWDANSSTTIKSCTATSSIILDTILRSSKLQPIEDFNINDTITIRISKYVNSYIDSLDVMIGNNTYVRQIANITNGYNLTFSQSEKSAIRDLLGSPQGTINFVLTTRDGGNVVGTSSQSALCSDLSQPLLRSFTKGIDGYKIGLNGMVDTTLENGVQVFGKLYLNGEQILVPTILYHDSDGSSTDITLSDSASNYEYFEIIAMTNEGYQFSTKVANPNGQIITLSANSDNGTYTWVKTGLIEINDDTITWLRQTECRIGNNVSTTHTTSTMYILEVLGYK